MIGRPRPNVPPPRLWKKMPLNILPVCDVTGILCDSSGVFICKYIAIKSLGGGTFGHVDLFTRETEEQTDNVAIKRPKFPQVKLLFEAFFQSKLHNDLIEYGLSSCVPKVYDIFTYQTTGDVWFSMEAFEPLLVSQWCVQQLPNTKIFILLLLQISLILEVFETILHIDHRDLKINNMIVVNEPIKLEIVWKNSDKTIEFPFRLVFVDFGFACTESIDIKRNGLPPLEPCPKEGRNIFQVLVSLWNIQSLRTALNDTWGSWIRKRISSVIPNFPCISLAESNKTLDWMYSLTDDKEFCAPLCAPKKIIDECMAILERDGIL